ncbi:hypothetical protein PoB_004135600 [Plakobranchus ocellatus]|uniref:Uncharacterized protein n=1 Tax=Plakobranchus ocellatus TaxID=259542 RepID=A0AAV4B7R5_9GAST|nr:hypothetical protein PoB_004135600 [Plakobranchus ocellatus]
MAVRAKANSSTAVIDRIVSSRGHDKIRPCGLLHSQAIVCLVHTTWTSQGVQSDTLQLLINSKTDLINWQCSSKSGLRQNLHQKSLKHSENPGYQASQRKLEITLSLRYAVAYFVFK